MKHKEIRIPLIVIGALMFVFKGMFASYEMNMIIPISNHGVGFALSGISIILILIGVFGYRNKSTSEEVSELKDRIKKLENDSDKKE